jgi:hypothetical protein
MKFLFTLALSALNVNAYWLMAIENIITTERIDPVVSKNKVTVSAHVHSVFGGSNFRFNTTTASLRQSQCTSVPIPQDKSAYWFPHLYFQWKNGSFTSLTGSPVVYYLFSDKPGTTTAFPDDFRMISGDPLLRTYTPTSAQEAVNFMCLDFNGKPVTSKFLPLTLCPNGIRAQINFPSCWDGKNLDSVDHKSHVAFLSGGPDTGTCSDPKFPVVLPRIFMEVYWYSNDFDNFRPQAMNPTQPFVFSHGDPVGYGYHADFINGWDEGILQNAVDQCNCNPYGDPQCCVDKNIFAMKKGEQCHITKSVDERTTGTLPRLAGNNPVQREGKTAVANSDNVVPPLIAPVYAYTGTSPSATGHIVTSTKTSSTPTPPKPRSSSSKGHNVAVVVPTSTASTDPTPGIQTPSLPTLSLPTPQLPTSVSPAAANSTPSSTSDSDPPETCGTTPRRRQSGLDYRRHHRRLSHASRHDHDFFHENY